MQKINFDTECRPVSNSRIRGQFPRRSAGYSAHLFQGYRYLKAPETARFTSPLAILMSDAVVF
jgi:hypothetical protein